MSTRKLPKTPDEARRLEEWARRKARVAREAAALCAPGPGSDWRDRAKLRDARAAYLRDAARLELLADQYAADARVLAQILGGAP